MKKTKVIILGCGLVGKVLYQLMRELEDKNNQLDITIISKEFKTFSKEKKCYYMLEKNNDSILEKYPVIRKFLGKLVEAKNTFIGKYSSIEKYEEIYSKKAPFYESTIIRPVSFRRLMGSEFHLHPEGTVFPCKMYMFGEWINNFGNWFDSNTKALIGEILKIDIKKKRVYVNQSEVGYDVLISTISLNKLDLYLTGSYFDNVLVDRNVGGSLRSVPIYIARHIFNNLDEFLFSGRRKKVFDLSFSRGAKKEEGSCWRVYDFDKDSPYYTHVAWINRDPDEQIEMYSLSTVHDLDFIAHKILNPGRVQIKDHTKVKSFLEYLRENNIYTFGRYGKWEGGRCVTDDMMDFIDLRNEKGCSLFLE